MRRDLEKSSIFDSFFFSLDLSGQFHIKTMGKQIRKAYRSRTDPLGSRVTAGARQGILEQQTMELQPDQVLPVIQKV